MCDEAAPSATVIETELEATMTVRTGLFGLAFFVSLFVSVAGAQQSTIL
jgi:hypothetical protein